MTPKVVQLKVILNSTNPAVWRRIQLLENSSLRTLHYAIQDVFSWKGYHSYIFRINNEDYSDPEFDTECEGWLDDSKFKVGDIAEKHPKFEFIYDFGDWWLHQIIFEKFVDADMTQKYPVCIDGKNAAPPEDCGGPPGFNDFKKAILNPKNKQHKELMNWYSATNLSSKFEAHVFNLEMINFRIGRRQKPSVRAGSKTASKKKPSLMVVK